MRIGSIRWVPATLPNPVHTGPVPSSDPGPPPDPGQITVRPAGPDDIGAIVELARAALGWSSEDPNEDFFRWKHLDNPAGRSPMWVAHDDEGLVGVRAFLRWRFTTAAGTSARAVRAVDTATHPRAQGRGIFTRLTLAAVQELSSQGVDFVFNTPNDQSRPGYLKMGWQVVGRVPIVVRPRGPRGVWAMSRARRPAAKWSLPSPAGQPALDVLADTAAVDELVGATASAGLATDRTAAHLGWRYGFAPLHYRAVTAAGGVANGLAVFRLRARGRAREATVCELLAPDARTARGLLHQVAATTGADYLIATPGAHSPWARRLVPMPGQGPILTWRSLDAAGAAGGPPPLDDWNLALGDVELF